MSTNKVSIVSSDIPSLLTIAFKFGDWLYILVQFWIVINAAVVGWLLTTKPLWHLTQRAIVTAIYLSIMSTNIVWILSLYSWMKKILGEIQGVVSEIKFQSLEQNIQPVIDSISKKKWWVMLFIAIVLSDLFALYCIWFLTSNPK